MHRLFRFASRVENLTTFYLKELNRPSFSPEISQTLLDIMAALVHPLISLLKPSGFQ